VSACRLIAVVDGPPIVMLVREEQQMPGQRPQRQMVDIDVIETSGVDHPAHGHEGWLVKKSASAGRVAALNRILKGTAMPTKDDLKKEVSASKLPDEQKTFMTKAIDLSDDVEAAAALWQSLRAKSEAEDPEIPTPAAVEQPAAAAPAPAAAPGLAPDVFKSVTDPAARAELAKAATENPALFKALETMQKQTAEALEKAEAERDARLDADAIAVSKSTYGHLAIDHDTVAPALRRLETANPELHATITKALGAIDGQAEAADLFKELGTSRPAETGSALAKAEAVADAMVAAGSAKTRAEGLAKAFDADPALYAAYEKEGR
jgi:hypothetical protein